jgi:hypothetical protein
VSYILRKIRKIAASVVRLFGTGGKQQHRHVQVHIISYPKCGRTWLRLLIGKALCDTFRLSEDKMLDPFALTTEAGLRVTKFTHDISSLEAGYDYRKLKKKRGIYRDKKVIFLARNVKDVLVSSYFHATKRKKLFHGSISEFIRSSQYGARKIVTFYNIWHANRHVPKDFLFITYEDLHEDPKGVLIKVLRFIGIDDPDERIVDIAVSFALFSNMKKMEETNVFKSTKMEVVDQDDQDSYKVRKGKVNGYTEYLSEEDVRYIDDVIREMGCTFCSR